MIKEPADIAVFLGENGQTAKFYGEGKIAIFTQEKGCWMISRKRHFSLKAIKGLHDFGHKMEEILVFLGGCRIFVASVITGIPFHFLEKAQFSIWEYDGHPNEFLDYILLQEQQNKKKTCKKMLTVEQGWDKSFEKKESEGLSILIKGSQGKSEKLTSKQLLLPFLRRGNFETLEIVSSHIPVWLEEEASRRRLFFQAQELGINQFKIILRNKI